MRHLRRTALFAKVGKSGTSRVGTSTGEFDPETLKKNALRALMKRVRTRS
jgi:hypothetical protein